MRKIVMIAILVVSMVQEVHPTNNYKGHCERRDKQKGSRIC